MVVAKAEVTLQVRGEFLGPEVTWLSGPLVEQSDDLHKEAF